MKILDAFKRSENVPPEVGEEDKFEEKNNSLKGSVKKKLLNAFEGKNEEGSESPEEPKEAPSLKPFLHPKNSSSEKTSQAVSGISDIQLEKINARLEEVNLRTSQFNERLARVSENIGELRAMNIANEKRIADSTKESEKVIDMFKDIHPEKLRVEYQNLEVVIRKLEESMVEDRQFIIGISKEFAELKKQSEAFLGTEGLVKMNDSVKSDLINIQKIAEKSRGYADKTKDLFLEFQSEFAEAQKISSTVGNLNESISSLKEEIERLKLKHGSLVSREDYNDFKRTFGNKLRAFESLAPEVEQLKTENQEISAIAEKSLDISRRNLEDIGSIGLEVGNRDVKKLTDYDNRLADILEIIEMLVTQVTEIKGYLGISAEQVPEESEENSANLEKGPEGGTK